VTLGLVVVAVALVVGRLAGGRVRALGRLPLRGGRVLAAAVALQVAAHVAARLGDAVVPARVLSLAAFACTGLVVAANVRLPGAPLAGLGLALNALFVGANGGLMPVTVRALEGAAPPDAGLVAAVVRDPLHDVADEDSRLLPLADVIPVPLPWRPVVASPGDLLLAAGLGLLVVEGMLVGRVRRAACEDDAPDGAQAELPPR
jgi:uncharacterized Zn-binding protein involved in type VI secretion